jgi:hypothetical protein
MLRETGSGCRLFAATPVSISVTTGVSKVDAYHARRIKTMVAVCSDEPCQPAQYSALLWESDLWRLGTTQHDSEKPKGRYALPT